MEDTTSRAIAIVGLGAILPDAPSVQDFWHNLCAKRYSITDVPPDRWSVANYYDPDPKAPEKTYSKIGGWVREFTFDWKQYHIPPRIVAAMDQSQQWAVTVSAQALADFGYPQRSLDLERTGVVMGTAMGGELHYQTCQRIVFPEFAQALESVSEFSQLPAEVRQAILERWHARLNETLPPVTEDSMPGELANVVSGRVANLLNLRGPNFVTDAACASSFAAILAAIELLEKRHCDAVITGGVDRNMGASTFVKFCKIGALSATGTRPFGEGADGFVMGEGAGAFLLKRLADAERAGDHIYAVLRGVGGSSDGRGKGITAPNPVGQRLAIQRAWENAGLDPASATLVEAHGTSTRVGDVTEVESLSAAFGAAPRQSIALGSVKSNIGHLKGGAGAAGFLKAALAICHKTLPPTLHAERPNPNIDFAGLPFYLNTELRDWPQPAHGPRRAGVSAYGFGGTNFHVVLEEHVPGALTGDRIFRAATVEGPAAQLPTSNADGAPGAAMSVPSPRQKTPLRGILALGAESITGLQAHLAETIRRVENGWTPPLQPPEPDDLRAAERLVIDFGDQAELLERLQKAGKALTADQPAAWKALQAQGVFRGSGPKRGKIAFLFPGQGSQYLNMGRDLAAREPVVAQILAEADQVMAPILGQPLTSFIFVDGQDTDAVKRAEQGLMQTAITQPAMLALDTAIYRLLSEYGFKPDMAMGHSLGEYAALIAAGVLPLADGMVATAARGHEMTVLSTGDNGWMAAVMAPLEVIEATLSEVAGYVVAANINSQSQCVIGGASQAVAQAIELFQQRGYQAMRIPVSHAFHTKIVAPASKPLRTVLNRLQMAPPRLPVIANVSGDFYPAGVEAIKDVLEQQVASPVQWIKGLETLYAAGVRTFIEVGPKKALKGFTDDVFAARSDVVSLFTNHPKTGEIVAFNQALCGLYAAGYGAGDDKDGAHVNADPIPALAAKGNHNAVSATAARTNGKGQMVMEKTVGTGSDAVTAQGSADQPGRDISPVTVTVPTAPPLNGQAALGQMLAQALLQVTGQPALGAQPAPGPVGQPAVQPHDRNATPTGSIIISGTGLGLPGAEKPVMDPENAMRILRGEQFVDLIPERFRKKMVAKQVTRVVKAADGSGSFETITSPDEVIRLAGRAGSFDLSAEYGVPEKLVEALDITTQLAMAAGLDALREAGIPLVQTWKRTSTGKYLPDRWLLPEALRDETGVVFASAFPGGERFADEMERYFTWQNRWDQIDMLEDLRQRTSDPETLREIQRRVNDLHDMLEREPYAFDRRFLFRVLAMGHSQLAEYIGARGPNTHVNAACASTAQAVAIAEDWIRWGRCRRVLVVGADNATGDHLMEWIGAGFVASGAAAMDDRVEEAALPFDRRRHGTIMGMGACALLLESEDGVRERGMRGIVELLSSETANSAFHGTRLDVEHMGMVMNQLVTSAELRFGLNRYDMAGETVFMSHETFTPARGGSASAEVAALRQTFGDAAGEIVMANTKGFTGHPMGVGVEDVIAVKILEYGIVPPVPNFKEVDPDLGRLNLSRGGRYPVRYAIHLAAGFGSQIAMTLTRRIPGAPDRIDQKPLYRRWLADVSGQDQAETEVVKRVLRIKAGNAPKRHPAGSTWRYGAGPVIRTVVSSSEQGAVRPASLPAVVPLPPYQAPAPAGYNGQTNGTVAASRAVAPPASPPAADVTAERAAPARLAPAATAEPSTPAPAPAGVAAQAPAVQDAVVEQVLAVVAEKTGYPQDMLDMDLDLEADLGVDTVKQAEIFAAIRQTFDIPRRDDLRLRDYPTLSHVVGFVHAMRPDLGVGEPVTGDERAPAVAPVAQPATAIDPVAPRVLAIVAEKTGYPQDMLDLDLDLEADLGVDTVKQAETFAAIRLAFDIPRKEDLKLRDYPTLAHVIGFVHDMRPDLGVAEQAIGVGAAPPQAVAFAVPPTEVAPAPTAGAQAALVQDPVVEKVLAIVAEKTGYPQDMLDLDLDLEADLGVDTVKQAETFAAIRLAFDIPRKEDLKLRDYPTLAHVIGFVHTMRPELRGGERGTGVAVGVAAGVAAVTIAPAVEADVAQVTPVAAPLAPTATGSPHLAPVEDANLVPRRVPVPVLRPPLDLCKETGVHLAKDSRVVVMLDEGGAGQELMARLEARGVTVLALAAPVTAAAIEQQIKDWLAVGPVQGVYWLPALDVEPELEALDLAGWRAANQARSKNLYTLMRALYGVVNGPNTFLVSATHLGGLHGYGSQGATAPLGGAVAGFSKAYKRERPETLVKVVDFALGAAGVADALLAETLFDPGAVEVGYQEDLRYAVGLEEQPAVDGQPGLALGKETVFLVTGAAGGITSAIVADLAAASGGIFYLLDLAEAPAGDDPLVALFRRDKEALKQRLIETLKAAGERATPAKVERQILAVERSEAALRAIEAVEAAGGTAYYHSLNLLDGPAVDAVIDDVRQRYGRIDVLLHAGGVEISRSLPDKEPKEFDLVFDVKAEGFYHLLHAAQGLPIGATVAFSSVAGRFGNAGQTDYSAANDLLCKITSSLRRWRPETRGIVIDWSAWGGIGMATRGSIPKIMEMAGIDLLPPQAGVPTIRRELTSGARRGELVVGGRLGMLANEWDADGGLDPAKAIERARAVPLPMLGQVKAVRLYPSGPAGFAGLEVETELDPKAQPFLHDHQFDGNPLLPGVMGVESFAELASLLAPGYRVLAVENVQFASPFKFYRNKSRTLHLNATIRPAAGGQLSAHTVLSSLTQPAGGKEGAAPQVKVHFTADVRLGSEPAATPASDFTPPAAEALPIGAGDIYKIYFHGPAYQVLERVGVEGQRVTGLLAENLPADTAEGPGSWLMAPRLIEFCFQTAGLWQIATQQTLALPMTVASVTTYRRPEDAGGSRLYARVSALDDGAAFDAQVVDAAGNIYVDLRGYRTVQVPGTVRLE